MFLKKHPNIMCLIEVRRKMQRNRELDSALKNLEKKFQKYQLEMRVGDIHKEMDYVLNVYNKKGLLHYIRIVKKFYIIRRNLKVIVPSHDL